MSRTHRRRLHPVLLVLLIVAALGLIVRLALPSILTRAINSRLAELEGYHGGIEDVDLHLYRGAYRIKGVSLDRTDDHGHSEPFLKIATIDFSLAWRELVRGRVVSDISLHRPLVRYARTEAPPPDAEEEGRRWQDVIDDLFPIEITRLKILDGEVQYADLTAEPKVDLAIRDLQALATGLRNHPAPGAEGYPSSIELSGTTIGEGLLVVTVDLEPLAPQPRFTLKLDLSDVDLTALNDFLEAYGNVDVSRGTLQLYLEVVAEDGAYEGYLKPFLEDVEFDNLEDRDKALLRRLWENVVAGLAALLKNPDREQVATRIPFSGTFEETEVGVWPTVVNLVRNGFVRALNEGFDARFTTPDQDSR